MIENIVFHIVNLFGSGVKCFVYRIVLCLIPALSVVSCSRDDSSFGEAFLADETPRLISNAKTVFRYEENSCQLSFNRKRGEFRLSTDNMSDYVLLTLNGIPAQKNEEIIGSVIWTTPDDIIEKKDITFTVSKLEGDTMWLVSKRLNLSLVVKILENP